MTVEAAGRFVLPLFHITQKAASLALLYDLLTVVKVMQTWNKWWGVCARVCVCTDRNRQLTFNGISARVFQKFLSS